MAMKEEWGLILPVDPTVIPAPAAQLKAMQHWAASDKVSKSKVLEVHADVRYYPPAPNSLVTVACPECKTLVDRSL